MGVTGLWSILDEISERKKLNDLSGKRVAIDLSGWVVQAATCPGLNTSKKPHLKNLFFKVYSLLRRSIHPIFVMEGKMPALKEAAFKKRNNFAQSGNENLSRSALDSLLKECHELLKSLGVPCIKARGEAEAYCAFLCLNQKVDGVITEDSDALLYGADRVYRGFTSDGQNIKAYSLKTGTNILKLDRTKCIALALLLGCDYVDGVPGIGKETALKLLKFEDLDVFQRFKDWREMDESQLFPGYDSNVKKEAHCKHCDHIGSRAKHEKVGCEICGSKIACLPSSTNPCICAWHKSNEIFSKHKAELKIYKAVKQMTDFPNYEVINEYNNYTDIIPEEDSLEWKCPNQSDFRELAYNFLNWSFDYIEKHFLPIMTAWQMSKLDKSCLFEIALCEPVKILKKRTVKGEACFDIQWILKDNQEQNSIIETEEFVDIFQKVYPKITETFYTSLQKGKDKSKLKKVSKSVKRDKKITDFMVSKKNKHQKIQENEILQCSDDGK